MTTHSAIGGADTPEEVVIVIRDAEGEVKIGCEAKWSMPAEKRWRRRRLGTFSGEGGRTPSVTQI
jgi:hypothetical protein